MKKLTPSDIIDRIEAAEKTLRRMPKVGVKGFGSCWPDIVRDFKESYGYCEATIRILPTAKDISEMDEVIQWLLWLDKYEVDIVRMRAHNVQWRIIERKLGWSQSKLKSDYRIAIYTIFLAITNPQLVINMPYKQHIQTHA